MSDILRWFGIWIKRSVTGFCPTLWPHEPKHARLLCPLLSCGVCSNSRALCWWGRPTVSSSVAFSSSCPQSFPAAGALLMCWLFASGGQTIGASASSSALPLNTQGWFPLGSTGLISLQSKELSRVFSSTIIQKYQFFSSQPSLCSNSHIHIWILKKNIDLTTQTFVDKIMSLLFNTLFSFVIAFLPRNKHLLIS